jgi:hypothetical protein
VIEWIKARGPAGVTVSGDGLEGDHGTTVMPYDTTELPTDVGEMLEIVVEDRKSGWLWCRSTVGREGWVAINTVDEII